MHGRWSIPVHRVIMKTLVQIVRGSRLAHGGGHVAPYTTEFFLNKRIRACFQRGKSSVDLGFVCVEEGVEMVYVEIR